LKLSISETRLLLSSTTMSELRLNVMVIGEEGADIGAQLEARSQLAHQLG
jgi:hypothetical protein